MQYLKEKKLVIHEFKTKTKEELEKIAKDKGVFTAASVQGEEIEIRENTKKIKTQHLKRLFFALEVTDILQKEDREFAVPFTSNIVSNIMQFLGLDKFYQKKVILDGMKHSFKVYKTLGLQDVMLDLRNEWFSIVRKLSNRFYYFVSRLFPIFRGHLRLMKDSYDPFLPENLEATMCLANFEGFGQRGYDLTFLLFDSITNIKAKECSITKKNNKFNSKLTLPTTKASGGVESKLSVQIKHKKEFTAYEDLRSGYIHVLLFFGIIEKIETSNKIHYQVSSDAKKRKLYKSNNSDKMSAIIKSLLSAARIKVDRSSEKSEDPEVGIKSGRTTYLNLELCQELLRYHYHGSEFFSIIRDTIHWAQNNKKGGDSSSLVGEQKKYIYGSLFAESDNDYKEKAVDFWKDKYKNLKVHLDYCKEVKSICYPKFKESCSSGNNTIYKFYGTIPVNRILPKEFKKYLYNNDPKINTFCANHKLQFDRNISLCAYDDKRKKSNIAFSNYKGLIETHSKNIINRFIGLRTSCKLRWVRYITDTMFRTELELLKDYQKAKEYATKTSIKEAVGFFFFCREYHRLLWKQLIDNKKKDWDKLLLHFNWREFVEWTKKTMASSAKFPKIPVKDHNKNRSFVSGFERDDEFLPIERFQEKEQQIKNRVKLALSNNDVLIELKKKKSFCKKCGRVFESGFYKRSCRGWAGFRHSRCATKMWKVKRFYDLRKKNFEEEYEEQEKNEVEKDAVGEGEWTFLKVNTNL